VPFFDKRINVGDGSEAKSTPKDRFFVTVGAILYLMFPTLVGGKFKMFDCRTVGKGTWLHMDMEESCSGDRYQLMRLLLGFSQLLLYVCGLPLLMLWFLVRNRGRLETLVVQSRYGLFFAGYVVLVVVVLCCGCVVVVFWFMMVNLPSVVILLLFFIFLQLQRRTVLLGNRLVVSQNNHCWSGCLWTISWSRVSIVGGVTGLVHFHCLGNFGGSFQRTHGTT
jgi:hypothetical protein